jgi:hypothetical protein
MKKLLLVLGFLFVYAGKGAAQGIEIQATFYKDARLDTVCTLATPVWHTLTYAKTWERLIIFSTSNTAIVRIAVGGDTTAVNAMPPGGVYSIDNPSTTIKFRATAATTIYVNADNKRKF